MYVFFKIFWFFLRGGKINFDSAAPILLLCYRIGNYFLEVSLSIANHWIGHWSPFVSQVLDSKTRKLSQVSHLFAPLEAHVYHHVLYSTIYTSWFSSAHAWILKWKGLMPLLKLLEHGFHTPQQETKEIYTYWF